MKRFGVLILSLGLVAASVAGSGPITSVFKYNGIFLWVKLGAIPPATSKTFARAKSILVDITFSQVAKVKKDANGNQWFTFILADQGSDWKWNQTTGSGAIRVTSGTIKPGKYTISIPVAGLSKTVLKDPKQFMSIGANTSGLEGKTAFTIDRIYGR